MLTPKSAKVLLMIAQGHSYQQIIDGNSDLVYPDIFAAAAEALKMVEAIGSDYWERMVTVKAAHPRAYLPWNEAEDETLQRMHQSGASVESIANHLQRQSSAIRARLQKLGPP